MVNNKFLGMLAIALMFGMALAGCKDSDSGGEETILEVTHVTGFQGALSDGSLIEIEVASTTDGNQPFTLYISGVKKGAGTLTLSYGSIIAIGSSPDASLTYSGGVCYGGNPISMRVADNTVWVHWGVYYGATMNDFTGFASQNGGDADRMYNNRPSPDDQGYYYGSPSNPVYATPESIYHQARQDHHDDAPPASVLNQALRVLNAHKNTGVGAYAKPEYLIAYYFKRVM